MDERRFDDLVRNFGTTGRSRRSLLKGMLAAAVSGAVGIVATGGAFAKNDHGNGQGNGNGNGHNNNVDCCPSSAPRLCDNHCVDFQTDPANCGGCAATCPTGAVCTNGSCVCPAGTTLCNDACVDTTSDANNCGTCGINCPAGATCQSGACTSTNGCTTDTDCPGGYGCSAGQCVVTCTIDQDCKAGFHCDSGSCVANPPPSQCTPGSTRSCYDGPAGTAGVGICVASTQTCAADGTWGACVGEVLPRAETCNGLDDNCNGVIDDVDPTLVSNDPNNCGACGHVCVAANGTANCSNGNCVVVACNPGFADCDGFAANGCEVRIDSDPDNCGACGNKCSTGNNCIGGACGTCPESSVCLPITYNPITGSCDSNPAPLHTLCDLNASCDGAGNCVPQG